MIRASIPHTSFVRPPLSTRIRRLFATSFGSVAMAMAAAHAAPSSTAPLYAQLPENIRQSGVIRVAGDDYAPYRTVAADGKTIEGLETDLLRAMEPLLGVRFEQIPVAGGPAAFAGLDVGRYELMTGPALSSPAREQRFDMVTWLTSKPAFMTPAANGIKPTRLLDLCGHRISLMSGSASEKEVDILDRMCKEAGLASITKVSLPDQNASRLAAQSGRSDAFSTSLAAGLYLNKIRPGEYYLSTDDGGVFDTLNLGAILKRNSPLSPVFAAAMQQLVDSGEYARILDVYGLAPAKVGRIRINISTGANAGDTKTR